MKASIWVGAGLWLVIALKAQTPVTDPLVIAKCGTCHQRQNGGILEPISYSRATPEAWQDEIRREVLLRGVDLNPSDARAIVKSLSSDHGLAPDEAESVLFLAERRVPSPNATPDDALTTACGNCHSLAVALSWRRSPEEWKLYVETHSAERRFRPASDAISLLASAAPLESPAWEKWRVRKSRPSIAGRWLVTAHVPGRGAYYGEMRISESTDAELTSEVTLTSARDGSQLSRTGKATVYSDYAWRGRSSGPSAADAREVMWFSADGSRGEGRWFWGQYQELGIDVKLQRPASSATLLGTAPAALKAGARSAQIRVIGDRLPPNATAAMLNPGDGIVVRRIVSSSPVEWIAEVDVDPSARPGKRSVTLGSLILPEALAVYDRVDYIQVVPDSAVASFGDAAHAVGYVPFEAIAYQRGQDGRLHTSDDLELGPIDVTWSVQIFHAPDESSAAVVGSIDRNGIFTPGTTSPGRNYDMWATATSTSELDRSGTRLTGKSYLVVSPAVYTIGGRRYVRDLDKWKDDGPAEGSTQ